MNAPFEPIEDRRAIIEPRTVGEIASDDAGGRRRPRASA